MTYTWGTTNRMYAIANRSGDPAQIAWVRHCRSKLTARRNRSAGHASHGQQSDIPRDADTWTPSADVRDSTGGRASGYSIRL